jgi:hypothetical protein
LHCCYGVVEKPPDRREFVFIVLTESFLGRWFVGFGVAGCSAALPACLLRKSLGFVVDMKMLMARVSTEATHITAAIIPIFPSRALNLKEPEYLSRLA